MPIPDEKARAWTRPEDYWPSRRPARSSRPAKDRRRRGSDDRGDPIEGNRLSLTAIPYLIVLAGLAIMAVAIMIMAWPGGRSPLPPPQPQAATAEVGTAPKGWIEQR